MYTLQSALLPIIVPDFVIHSTSTSSLLVYAHTFSKMELPFSSEADLAIEG